MPLKAINRIFIILASLIFAVLIGYMLVYLIFPMPKILNLLPDTAMAYLDVYGLDNVLVSTKNSEFVKRVSESSLWSNFKTTKLCFALEQDLMDFQQLGLDKGTLNRLIGKHAIVAVHTIPNSQEIGYLLVSELDMPTRLLIASGQIERFISPQYELIREKYKGFTLITLQSPEWKYTYAFAGRAGLLATDANLVKDAINIYKHLANGLPMMPEFGELTSNLPLSDVSFFINAEKVQESAQIFQRYGIYPQNFPFINNIRLWAGIVSNPKGELKIDNFILNRNAGKDNKELVGSVTPLSEKLPLPDKSLAFVTHNRIKPEELFRWMEKYISPRLYIFRQILLPIVHESLAEAIIAPKAIEYQTVPSFVFFMGVGNKFIAEEVLKQLKEIITSQNSQLKFEEIEYGGKHISYSSSFPGIYLPVGIGYTIIKDDLLVLSTDISTLKAVIDTSNGKHQPITKQMQYMNVMSSFSDKSDNMAFINLNEIAPITQQFAKLYLFQSMLTGRRGAEKYEKYALMLADNAFIMQSWNYLGATWASDSSRSTIKLTLRH
jgi:hypothetical protein